MQGKTVPAMRLWMTVVLLLTLFGSAQAGNEDYLKLMVTDCGDSPLDNASVRVVLHRGSQQLERVSAYTNDGYVEFMFDNLRPGDTAEVTVTPEGGQPDGDHMYTYVWQEGMNDPTIWDLGEFGACPDDWWEEDPQVIQCACDTAD